MISMEGLIKLIRLAHKAGEMGLPFEELERLIQEECEPAEN